MKRLVTFGCALVALASLIGPVSAQDRDPVTVLAALLRDSSPEVRRAAAFALKYYPQVGPAIPSLIEAFKDGDEIVRANAVDAIVLVAPREVVPTLILALRDKDPLKRRHAALALGRIRRYTEQAVPDLVLLLKDDDDNVRQTAAEALKQIQQSRREY
jgi:HEAT repeat protein